MILCHDGILYNGLFWWWNVFTNFTFLCFVVKVSPCHIFLLSMWVICKNIFHKRNFRAFYCKNIYPQNKLVYGTYFLNMYCDDNMGRSYYLTKFSAYLKLDFKNSILNCSHWFYKLCSVSSNLNHSCMLPVWCFTHNCKQFCSILVVHHFLLIVMH